jgi:hypothetical protein
VAPRGAEPMTDTPIVLPIVNLNGTSRQELLRQYVVGIDGLQKAITALREMAPHGRDYPGADGVFFSAREQWRDIVGPVERSLETLNGIAEEFATKGGS